MLSGLVDWAFITKFQNLVYLGQVEISRPKNFITFEVAVDGGQGIIDQIANLRTKTNC